MSGITVWVKDYDTGQEEGRPVSPFSEECCEELWDRVEGVRQKLTRILNPAKLTPYLRQCKVIDEQDEDEVLNSTQYPLRISKAGRLIDILHGRGQRGLQAFMESLEFYHPEQYTQLTGKQPTQRCSIILDEEGPEGLTQFLLLEVRKLREQLRGSRVCERRLSQRCRVAEEERSRAERKTLDLRHDRLQMERLRQDWEAGSRELGRLNDRHLEQAMKYSCALEDQAKASARERELLEQVEQLKTRLMEAEKETDSSPASTTPFRRNSSVLHCTNGAPAVPEKREKPLQHIDIQKAGHIETQALLDILKQDRREATEQRHELCGDIARLQGELESSEDFRDKLESQCEQLQLKVRTLQLDWETEQKRSISYFNQIMELEKERDQALRSRDSLQLEYTDCLLDKNRLLSPVSVQRGPVLRALLLPRPQPSAQLHSPAALQDSGQFDLDSWGSDENENLTGVQSEVSLSNSCSSLHSHLIPPDLVNLPPVPPHKPNYNSLGLELLSPLPSPPTTPKRGRGSLADDITIIGGNCTGIFVSSIRAGSPAEQCGLKEGSELLELEKVMFGGGSVLLGQCTGEVAHFSLQWWTEPSSLKHQNNTEAYSKLCSLLSSPTFYGADSFYVRVNLDLDPHSDLPCLGVRCDDIIHVTDTRYNGKYQWRCTLVNPHTAKPLQAGVMPNYNRAQQLLLVRLRTIALGQKDFKKKVSKKGSERVRLVKAVSPSCRGIGSTPQVLYTLSNRHEEHLIPYSMVQPIQVKTKRPVIFSPSLLSRGLIERLLQPAESGLDFNTCQPEPIQATERNDKSVFLLDASTPEQALGIRLQSIQDVISQADELQLETLPLLYHTLEPNTWSCTDDLLLAIRNVIHSQQKALLWVELERLQ
ncbi:unnamed protein product [Coregonus sp. 'balchen']|nr:unnamed protein product [Coregonus sp. 'balchen']